MITRQGMYLVYGFGCWIKAKEKTIRPSNYKKVNNRKKAINGIKKSDKSGPYTTRKQVRGKQKQKIKQINQEHRSQKPAKQWT